MFGPSSEGNGSGLNCVEKVMAAFPLLRVVMVNQVPVEGAVVLPGDSTEVMFAIVEGKGNGLSVELSAGLSGDEVAV